VQGSEARARPMPAEPGPAASSPPWGRLTVMAVHPTQAPPRRRPVATLVATAVVLVAVVGQAAGAGSSGVVRTSDFGVQHVSTATVSGRVLAVWSGESRGASAIAAEHSPGRGSWEAVLLDPGEAGAVVQTDVAADATGRAVAVWAVLTETPAGSRVRVRAARRSGPARWSPAQTLADLPGGAVGGPSGTRIADVEMTPGGGALVVMGAADGSVISRAQPPGSADWGPPQIVRPAGLAPAYGADVALAVDAAGDATVLWNQGSGPTSDRSIGTADLRGDSWSVPAALPGAAGGRRPSVVATGRRLVVAFDSNVGVLAAVRPPGGAWPRASRVGEGFAPELVAHAGTVALSWQAWAATTRLATLGAAGAGWRALRPPVPPDTVAIARDGALVIGGRASGGAVEWTRLTPAGRSWTRPRIVAGPAVPSTPVALAQGRAGATATLLWTANVPRGLALRYADLRQGTGVRTGDEPRLRLAPTRALRRVTAAVVPLSVRFTRYTGPARVRAQVAYGDGPWRAVNTLVVDADRDPAVRLGRAGAARVRLAYGRGFRRATNAVAVTISRPARARIVAGWEPLSLAARGRDLWVLSITRGGSPQLRLLDAGTGRPRRGPVAVPSAFRLVETGGPPLVALTGGGFRALDAARPGLLGAPARLVVGSCGATCVPTTLTVGAATSRPSRSVGDLSGPVSGPDGTIWATGAVRVGPDGEPAATEVLQSAPGAAPLLRGEIRPVEGASSGEFLAVPGGVWTRDVRGDVTWFGASGAGLPRGSGYLALTGARSCVWGLRITPGGDAEMRRLRGREAQPPVVRPVDAEPARSAGPGQLALGRGAAWMIAPVEQTLVRVPLPAC